MLEQRRPPRTRSRISCALVFGVACSVAGATASSAWAGGKMVEGVVNLNTAPAEMLSALPGIGPAKAVGILAYRTRHPFRTVDELVRVKGIGRRMVQAMRSHLAVSGPSTARALLSLPAAATAGPAAATPSAPVRAPLPVCRAPPLPPPPAAVARAVRATQARSIRVIANHCLPPA
jgi:competence protein ComEA